MLRVVRDAAGCPILLACYAFAFSTMYSTIARQILVVMAILKHTSAQKIGAGIVESKGKA
jgi:hypothetical protein